MLRTIVEQLSRGVVVKRRFSQRFGRAPVYVSPGSALRFWRFELDEADPALLNTAEEIVSPGSVVWDIGANVGLFTFCAAALAGKNGRVIAVEPDLWLASLLNKSARVQPHNHAPVTVVPAAVCERLGVTTLHIAAQGRSKNFITGGGSANSGPIRTTQTAVTVTLDWLAQHMPPPDVLKIDVEGMEATVLRGAEAVLTNQPKILCEVYSETQQEVAVILRRHGYIFHDSEDAHFKQVDLPTYNTMALPGTVGADLHRKSEMAV